MPEALFLPQIEAARARAWALYVLAEILELDPRGWVEIRDLYGAYAEACEAWTDVETLAAEEAAGLFVESCKAAGLEVRPSGSDLLIRGVALTMQKKAEAHCASAS